MGLTLLSDTFTLPPELRLLSYLAGNALPDSCIVELGVFRGGSLRVLCENCPPDVPVYGIDLFGGEGTPEYYTQTGSWISWWEWRYSTTHSWTDTYEAASNNAPDAILVKSDTAQAGRLWQGPPVSLLYIDGDHSYEGVKADWLAWLPNLDERFASVVFDDYRYMVRGKDHYPGVTQFVDELGLPLVHLGKAAMVQFGTVPPESLSTPLTL